MLGWISDCRCPWQPAKSTPTNHCWVLAPCPHQRSSSSSPPLHTVARGMLSPTLLRFGRCEIHGPLGLCPCPKLGPVAPCTIFLWKHSPGGGPWHQLCCRAVSSMVLFHSLEASASLMRNGDISKWHLSPVSPHTPMAALREHCCCCVWTSVRQKKKKKRSLSEFVILDLG